MSIQDWRPVRNDEICYFMYTDIVNEVHTLI